MATGIRKICWTGILSLPVKTGILRVPTLPPLIIIRIPCFMWWVIRPAPWAFFIPMIRNRVIGTLLLLYSTTYKTRIYSSMMTGKLIYSGALPMFIRFGARNWIRMTVSWSRVRRSSFSAWICRSMAGNVLARTIPIRYWGAIWKVLGWPSTTVNIICSMPPPVRNSTYMPMVFMWRTPH